MLPIYPAVSFVKQITKGGSTYPWLVEVAENESLVPYVVKLFTYRQTAQYQPLVKEVLGNALAQMFDLPVPKVAFINFGQVFIESLPDFLQKELQDKDHRICFGSRFEAEYEIVETKNLKKIFKNYDLGSIYAFDNLIWNTDRGGFRNKPNLLINNEDFLLIDHELILPFTHVDTIQKVKNGIWEYNFQKHLFYPILKNAKNTNQNHIFDTFAEYLVGLNFNNLDIYQKQLEQDLQFDFDHFTLIKKYLQTIQQHSNWFIRELKRQIA